MKDFFLDFQSSLYLVFHSHIHILFISLACLSDNCRICWHPQRNVMRDTNRQIFLKYYYFLRVAKNDICKKWQRRCLDFFISFLQSLWEQEIQSRYWEETKTSTNFVNFNFSLMMYPNWNCSLLSLYMT